MSSEQVWRYAWRNNAKRAGYYGRLCKAICWGPKVNSVMVEFLDNRERTVTSRHAIRKVRGDQTWQRGECWL